MRVFFVALLLSVCACVPPAETTPQRDTAAELEDVSTCGYAGCRGPFHLARELDFGLFAVGATLPSIPRSASCQQANLQGRGPARMCSFAMDGVTYISMDGVVVGKEMDVAQETASGLPFGLNRDQTLEQALEALRAHTEAPMSIKTFPGGDTRYISNDDVLKNAHDHPFLFTLLFVDDRLARIMVQDPSAPSD